MLTGTEKMVLNAIVLSLLALFSFALYEGMTLFVIKAVCRVIYYMTGTTQVGPLCDGQ